MSARPEIPADHHRFGADIASGGVRFTVRAPDANTVTVCLFDDRDRETARQDLFRQAGGVFTALIAGVRAGDRYGLRAKGPYEPDRGHRFDPSKLLVDPYAVRLDRPFAHDPRLALFGEDTACLVPKAIIEEPLAERPLRTPRFEPGGLIYELPVRAFTMLHPEVPAELRGTLPALAHPAIIDHLQSLHVAAIQLMPIAAWIDERHLPPLGLRNAWGYNPVTMLALDPRLAPGGIADLRQVTDAMHAAEIDVIVDMVFNHTGESDLEGPTLSLRGLGNAAYYRHQKDHPGIPVNDTGCGNTLACDRPVVQELLLAAARHLVLQGGVDGFRFDLATVLGRNENGFSRQAAMLEMLRADPALGRQILIAEPWDIGPGGYQLGHFPPDWLEWNDRTRDDFRRFWRGDPGMIGALASRLAGSSDVFERDGLTATRSVNFLAAHDGFPLGDLVTYRHKHNAANGEHNRDGHDENFSWNNGVEGDTADPAVRSARQADIRALMATLFASRGTILLSAGDEFGHTQRGNNNAYAQDNAITWRDWNNVDRSRLDFTCACASFRAHSQLLHRTGFLVAADGSAGPDQVEWLRSDGGVMTTGDWEDPARNHLIMVLGNPGSRLAAAFNRSDRDMPVTLPATSGAWQVWPSGSLAAVAFRRSVTFWREILG